MNGIKKSKVLSVLLCAVMLISMLVAPISVAYSTETEDVEIDTSNPNLFGDQSPTTEEEPDATEELEEETEPSETEEEPEEAPVVFDWKAHYDPAIGQIDGNRFTVPSEGVYALKLSANVIEDLDQVCYIYLMESDHKNCKIRIELYPESDFVQTIYLPSGYYQVIETGVKNSPTLTFKLTASAVSLNASSESAEIQLILNNAGDVVKNDLGVWTDKAESETQGEIFDEKLFGVEALEGVQSNANGVFYYSATHVGAKKIRLVDKEVEINVNGQYVTEIQQVEEVYYEDPGPGYVGAFGSAKSTTDIVMVITKGGVVGQAEFKISYDGGQTFFAKYVTDDVVTDSTVGLTYTFYALNDTDEFVEGDRFTLHVLESFAVETSTSAANIRISCVGHPVENHYLLISILSSGGRGISRVKVADKDNNMETKTYLIPEDGILVLDDNLTIYFENVDGYNKGVEYEIRISSHDTTIDYTPLFFLCAGVVVVLFIALIWLLMKKDKRRDYIVQVYQWKQDDSAYE